MDERFVIGLVRRRDLGRILEIEEASFGADAYDRNLFAEYTRKCGGLFLVAKRGTRVCAYSITAICPSRTRNRAELVSVAVDPGFRGTGAASALMDSTLRRLRRRGITRLGLMVKVTNQRALAFYKKYGFRKPGGWRATTRTGLTGFPWRKTCRLFPQLASMRGCATLNR
jgi:ribosomal-protein-alanine N-acetyltransferase